MRLKPRGTTCVHVILFTLFALASDVFSQSRFELGARVDLPPNGLMTTYSYFECFRLGLGAPCTYESVPLHPAIGVSASTPISRRFRIRFDPTYQRIGLNRTDYTAFENPPREIVDRSAATANRWQIPALLEASPHHHIRVGIGPAVSLLTGAEATRKRVDTLLGTGTFPDIYTFPVSRNVTAGVAAALELPFRCRAVILAPEVRYRRWFAKHYGGHSKLDELTVGVALRLSR